MTEQYVMQHIQSLLRGIIKVTSAAFIKVANYFKSVCRQQHLCVSEGCLTV
jgi:hypothetical protein